MREREGEKYRVIPSIEIDNLFREEEGAMATLIHGKHGSEEIHGFTELRGVEDGDDRVRAVVLRERGDVRPLGPLAERDPWRSFGV